MLHPRAWPRLLLRPERELRLQRAKLPRHHRELRRPRGLPLRHDLLRAVREWGLCEHRLQDELLRRK